MNTFPQATQNYMAARCSELRPDLCSILRRSVVDDGAGGSDQSYTVSTANVSCRVERGRGTEGLIAGTERATKFRKVRLAASTDVRPTDRIHVTRAGGSTVDVTYEILDVGDNSYNVERVVQCVEIS